MKTATGLMLVAIGAILAFAVHAHLHFLDLAAAGWVIMVTGLAGMFVPRRGYGWLRSRVVINRPARRSAGGRASLPAQEYVAEAVQAGGLAAPEAPLSPEGTYAGVEDLRPPVSETIQELFEE